MGQPKYERGIFPRGQKISGASKLIEAGIEALNPYPMNLQTGERELATPGLFEAIAMGGRGIASAIKDPSGTYEKLAPVLDEMGKRMVASTTLRPGQMEMVDGQLRPLTSDEVVRERIDAGMDPTVALAGGAPIARGIAKEGIGALVSEPGVVTSGGARKEYGVKLVGAEDPNFENKVVELPTRFETDNPALKNMSVSYVEPPSATTPKTKFGPNRSGEIEKYALSDMPAPEKEIGIVRLTAPTEDLATVPKETYHDASWKGPIHKGHMPMFVGGEKGFSQIEVSRLRNKLDDLYEEGIETFRAEYGAEPDEDVLKQIMASTHTKVRQMPEYQDLKNAPVGFARFVDTRIVDKDGMPLSGDKEYMRTTEIQSDLFAESRGDYIQDDVPETYENISKDDKPLTASIVKGLVVTAKDRGKKGLVLPSSETSEAGVRYSSSNLKKLTNKVKKDLGEGYSVRKVYVENKDISIYKPDTIKPFAKVPKFSEQVVIEWDTPEMPDAVKFATGGLVSLPPQSASRGIEDVIRKYRQDGLMD